MAAHASNAPHDVAQLALNRCGVTAVRTVEALPNVEKCQLRFLRAVPHNPQCNPQCDPQWEELFRCEKTFVVQEIFAPRRLPLSVSQNQDEVKLYPTVNMRPTPTA